MTPQELKNSILQLAIQGKLVEQRAEEGTAEKLYAQIQEENKKLVTEGKIKKQKPLPAITEDEKPFDIPKSWKWVRWGNLSTSIQYGYNAPGKTSGTIKMVRISDIQDNKILWENVPWCDISEDEIDTYVLQKNDILFARTGGTVGKSFLVKNVTEEAVYAGYLIRTRYSKNLEPQYLKFFMESTLYWLQLRQGTIATAQPNCNGKVLAHMILPLPPLAEQQRIVAKIEELLLYIDRYEKAWSKLEAFNKRFPSDMQKSLLQYAIEGKLVEQRAEEGTAEELFAQIQAEKEKLVTEGKIKKQKPLPAITEDEKPFDIPESWKWVRLGEVVTVLGGKRIPAGRKLTTEDTGYKYIRVSDMKNETVITSGLLFLPKDIYPIISNYIINKEDIYITVAGTIGRVGSIPDEIDGANLTENADRLVFSFLNKIWLIKFLLSQCVQRQIADVTTKVGQPKLAIKRIQNLIIPLPPLAEQQRIVERLEELLPLCERLKRPEIPNSGTKAAMLEGERILHDPSVKHYSNVEEALKE